MLLEKNKTKTDFTSFRNAFIMFSLPDYILSLFSLQENDDFETRSTLVKGLLHEQGQALVHSLIHSCVFCLPTYMAVDLGEVVYEIMLLDRPVSVFSL